MLWICLEEYVCLYRPNARWEGEFESRGQKTGFQENDPSSSKNKLQHIQLSDTTGTSNGTGFYGQMKQKN